MSTPSERTLCATLPRPRSRAQRRTDVHLSSHNAGVFAAAGRSAAEREQAARGEGGGRAVVAARAHGGEAVLLEDVVRELGEPRGGEAGADRVVAVAVPAPPGPHERGPRRAEGGRRGDRAGQVLVG